MTDATESRRRLAALQMTNMLKAQYQDSAFRQGSGKNSPKKVFRRIEIGMMEVCARVRIVSYAARTRLELA